MSTSFRSIYTQFSLPSRGHTKPTENGNSTPPPPPFKKALGKRAWVGGCYAIGHVRRGGKWKTATAAFGKEKKDSPRCHNSDYNFKSFPTEFVESREV